MILKGFIVFEGIDGCGTTTQLERTAKRLIDRGMTVFKTREPTDGPVGKLIRECLAGRQPARQEDLARLFAADRSSHLRGPGGILAALEAGSLVFSDRYLFSSLAYQSLGSEPLLPFALNADFPLPEQVFFFDLEPETSFQRLSGRPSLDIFETLPFQQKVARRYRQVMDLFSESGMVIHRVDASAPVNEVDERIWEALEPRLSGFKAS